MAQQFKVQDCGFLALLYDFIGLLRRNFNGPMLNSYRYRPMWSKLGSLFRSPMYVRHPEKKDPETDPTSENYPCISNPCSNPFSPIKTCFVTLINYSTLQFKGILL